MFNLNATKGVFYVSVGRPCAYLGNHWINYMYISELTPINIAGVFSVAPNFSAKLGYTVPTVDDLLESAQNQIVQQGTFDAWHLEKIALRREQVRLLFRRWSKLDQSNNPRSAWLVIDQPFLAMKINIHNANSSVEVLKCLINMSSDEHQSVQVGISIQSADASAPPALSNCSF